MTIFILSVFINLYSQQRSSVLLNNDILVMKTEGNAFLGSGMNEDDAKIFAINDAKRTALEQAGTYIESHTTILNYQLVKDEVITFSAGLVKVRVLNTARELINNMFAFKVDIEATIDIKLLDERIKEIRSDSKLKQQLEAEQERNKQLEARIAELQSSGSTASKQTIKNVIDELSASDWYNKGVGTKGNLAIYCYTKAIELNPQFADAYEGRAVAYCILDNLDAAIRDYSKVIELNPQLEGGYVVRGITYSNLGHYSTAILDFNKAIELDPQYALAYYSRGDAYYNLGNYGAAILDFSKDIELNPQDADAYCSRGDAYSDLGNYSTAILDFNKAIDLNPQNADANGNRGVAYAKLGKVDAFIRDYKKASAYYGRGNAYRLLGNYDTAIQDYNRAIELNPQYADAYFNRGLVYYYRLVKYDMAVQDFNNFLRINGGKNGDAEKVRQLIRNLGYTPQY